MLGTIFFLSFFFLGTIVFSPTSHVSDQWMIFSLREKKMLPRRSGLCQSETQATALHEEAEKSKLKN